MEKKEKKSNKKLILIIVLCFIGYLLIMGLPFLIIFGVALIDSEPLKYTEKDGIINVTKYDIDIELEDSFYDEDSNCYIIKSKVNRVDKSKSISNSLSVNYTLKDKDGYILGETSMYISELKKNTKWKAKAEFCDIDAKEVSSYELKDITNY